MEDGVKIKIEIQCVLFLWKIISYLSDISLGISSFCLIRICMFVAPENYLYLASYENSVIEVKVWLVIDYY